jgi:type III secretion protein Q
MSATLKVRTLSAGQLPRYRSVRALQAAGRQAALRTLAPPRGYAQLQAMWEGREHTGWADLAELLRRRYPELHELAWRALDERYVLDLFNEPGTMAWLPAPPGGWARVRLTGIVQRELPEEALLCFDEPESSPVLFREFPAVAPSRAGSSETHAGSLPLVMRFCIGTSIAPLSLLSAIGPGDALVIQSHRQVVRVGGKPLCSFQYEGMDIMLNEQIYDEDEDNWDEPAHADAAPDEAGAPPAFEVDALPIKLEFVLQEEQVTVAELAQVHAGVVLPMREGAVGNVAIRANGRLLGTGELIQVGEQLAVEVRSVRLAAPK